MTALGIALIKAMAGLAVIIAGLVWFRRDATKDAKANEKLMTAKEALKQERERNARDETLNGAADLAAIARASGVVRHTEH